MSGVTRTTITPSLLNFQLWPQIDVSALPSKERLRIERLTKALQAYVEGRKMRALLKELKLSRTQVLRALDRCTTVHPDGKLYGWRGLLAGAARKPYKRIAPATRASGSAGALHQLFGLIPGLQERLTNLILKRGKDVHEACISSKALHRAFIDECRQAKIPATNWPFTARQLGRRSIDRFMNDVLIMNPERAAKSRYGDVASSKLFTGTGDDRLMLALAPFDVAEMDGHRIDMIGGIGIPTPLGVVWVPIERVQLLLIADGSSGAIISYFAVVRRECKSSDILAAAENLEFPWNPRDLRVPGMKYPDGGGLPLGIVEGLSSCAFAALMVDNALINIGFAVTDRLRSRLGCAINWGPTRKWMRRPLIERINKALEEKGFQRTVSTTGSHPKDPRKNDPVGSAVKHLLHLEEVLDLIDVVIANYNSTASEGRYSLSPLEVLSQTAAGTACPTLLPVLPPKSGWSPALNRMVFEATVRGSAEKGRRPAIKFERQNYTNKVIARDFKLIGKKVLLHVDPSDIRAVDVYLSDSGMPLGKANVLGRWRRNPHSLEFRRQINRAIADKSLEVPEGTDPVTAMHDELSRRAAKRAGKRKPTISSDATDLARERRTTNQPNGPYKPPPEEPRAPARSRHAPSFKRHI